MNQRVKKRIGKAMFWIVLLNGSETWARKATMIQRIEAYEMWVWIKTVKISWTDRKTNAEVLSVMGKKRQFVVIRFAIALARTNNLNCIFINATREDKRTV